MQLIIASLLFVTLFNVVSSTQASVITPIEALDLELVSRNNGEPGGIMPVIDRTISKVGHQALKNLLVNPITDIETLEARQALVMALQNKELSKKIQAQLVIIKQHEDALQRCFDKASREQLATVLKKNYFRWGRLQGLNESQIALDVLHLFEFASLFGPLIEHMILHFALNYLSERIEPQTNHDHAHHSHCDHDHDCGHNHDHSHQHHHDHGEDHACVDCLLKTDDKTAPSTKVLFNIIKVGHFAFHLFNIKEMVDHLVYKADIIDLIHQELISVHACIKASATIGDLLAKANLPIQKAAINADILISLCGTHTELVLQSLDPNFAAHGTNNLKLFSRVGPTLAVYESFGKQAELINDIMAAAGSIDAMLSMSTLLEQHNQYSFVQYKAGNQPYIELKEFIHPQLTGPEAVANSIILDKETGSHRLVITGPNKAGKSSVTKAIAVNLVLAQTFGITAAKKAVITPVHRIITYINILDNLAENSSMFLAEIIRADQAILELTALDHTVPTFALFDDSLFRSTQPAEGEVAAYKFVKKIVELLRCTTLVVTHFEKLTQLEAETGGKIHNYKVGLVPAHNGKTLSTFKLERGISPRDEIFCIVCGDDYQSDLLTA